MKGGEENKIMMRRKRNMNSGCRCGGRRGLGGKGADLGGIEGTTEAGISITIASWAV